MAQKKKQIYKSFQPGLFLYTPTYDQLFEKGSVERVIVNFIDSLDMRPYEEKYEGGGTSSYHPSVMLKIILIAYARNEFGCRRIERVARHDMCCQYICNGQTPSYSTINRFRSNILGEEGVKNIFGSLLERLSKEGLISFEECFTDGTTLEARASRKKIVWQQSERRYAAMNKRHIEDIVAQALKQQEQDTEEEERECPGRGHSGHDGRSGHNKLRPAKEEGSNPRTGTPAEGCEGTDCDSPKGKGMPEPKSCADSSKETKKGKRGFDSHITLERLGEIEKMIKNGEIELSASKLEELKGAIAKALDHRAKDLLCGERSGTALTDTDTVAMHPKDDTRRTGPCLPMYNLMVTTESQYFLAYGLYGRTNDMSTFPLYLGELPDRFKGCTMVADAGFGSYENYKLAERYGLRAVFKYSSYDSESKPTFRPNPYDAAYMPTDIDGYLICPGGRLTRTRTVQTSRNGITITRVHFKGESCPRCPYKDKCIKNKDGLYRTCEVNLEWKDKLKPAVKELLDNNAKLLKQRTKDVEPKFSHLRYDNLYSRLRHFGRSKCMMDIGIMLITLNLKKYASQAREYLASGQPSGNGRPYCGLSGAFLSMKLYFEEKIRKYNFSMILIPHRRSGPESYF